MAGILNALRVFGLSPSHRLLEKGSSVNSPSDFFICNNFSIMDYLKPKTARLTGTFIGIHEFSLSCPMDVWLQFP